VRAEAPAAHGGDVRDELDILGALPVAQVAQVLEERRIFQVPLGGEVCRRHWCASVARGLDTAAATTARTPQIQWVRERLHELQLDLKALLVLVVHRGDAEGGRCERQAATRRRGTRYSLGTQVVGLLAGWCPQRKPSRFD